jgi:hypothetical protein
LPRHGDISRGNEAGHETLPNQEIDTSGWKDFSTLTLADPNFNRPGPIDMLLGADAYNVIVLEATRMVTRTLCLRDTLFGWIVSGSTMALSAQTEAQSNHVLLDDATLRRFWEIEEIPTQKHHTREEIECEEHFERTTTREPDGRFKVQLPFKKDAEPLGHSLFQATKRFHCLERRFEADPKIKRDYTKFMDEFLSLGHMEEIPPDEISSPVHEHFYLPHHCVFKDTSTTTKMRVVFDASAKTDSGISLNDNLLVGPRLQDDLFDILIRLRFYHIAFSADVGKMYRQISLDTNDKDFHRILWRESSSEPLRHYRMKRVSYGVGSSAYHSIKAMQAVTNGQPESAASHILKKDFYVDDLISGANSTPDAIKIQDELLRLLNSGQFELRKWTSSDLSLINRLPEELRETSDTFPLDGEDGHRIKALGIHWRPGEDHFFFVVSAPPETGTLTKRKLLSDTARLFDPIGWLAPVVVWFKCLLQEIWALGADWDSPLPEHIVDTWTKTRADLTAIQNLRIPRSHLTTKKTASIQLHVFSDASEAAYAACVYTPESWTTKVESRPLS